MNKLQVSKLFALLTAAYPNSKYTEQTAQVYELMLQDLDHGAAEAAIKRLITSSKWLPTVAEIREAAVAVEHGPRRLAGEAWGDVVNEIRRVGSYGCPKFEDPLVAKCVQAMGWRDLCRSTTDAADRARFADLYNGLAERERGNVVAGPGLRLPEPKGNKPVGDLLKLIGSGGR